MSSVPQTSPNLVTPTLSQTTHSVRAQAAATSDVSLARSVNSDAAADRAGVVSKRAEEMDSAESVTKAVVTIAVSVSHKSPAVLDSSGLTRDSETTETASHDKDSVDKKTVQDSTTALSSDKADECQEKASETASGDKDADAADVESEDVNNVAESSVHEQQLRQIMTLPSDILPYVSLSSPISLSLQHHSQLITVPAANVYRSTSGLKLLLPPDSLPVEYIDSKQLACTLGQCDDVKQTQLISISLTVQ